MNVKAKKNNKIIHIILIIGSISMLLPFIWMVLTSLKSLTESTQMPLTILPKVFVWKNYPEIFKQLPFVHYYINTIIMIVARVACAIVFSSMAAYSFARLKFPGRDLFFMLVLIQMMIPSQIFIIPQFLIVLKLGWLDSIQALIVPGLVSAFGTFLLRQFFLSVPDELEEAAILDGCNKWQIYYRIMLPLAKSGLIALGIFTALFAFKDLMWPLIVNMSPEKMTLSAGLASLKGQFSTNYPELMAGSMFAILPMLIIFIAFQKQFVQGIATTGSKN